MEQLLHYVWKYRLFPLHPLLTTDGQEIEVIDPGLPNLHAGPDFFNAKIRIGDTLWVGYVEIHERASDWFRHHHNQNPLYDSVVLHVVSQIDATPCRMTGDPIPQLELHCPPHLLHSYRQLVSTLDYPACWQIIPKIPSCILHGWLNTLQAERFEQKADQVSARVKFCKGNWSDALFLTLARNFGFGINNDVFEQWARTIPLHAVARHRNDLFQIEAFFFGLSGLLHGEVSDAYSISLAKEYEYLAHKFGLSTAITPCYWKFLRLRPSNFPHLRIAQLAVVYQHIEDFFSLLMKLPSVHELHALLQGGTSAYWRTHYSFGKESSERSKSLSRSSINLLILNTVVPFCYAYAKHRGDERIYVYATSLLESMKAEDNHIVRMWKEFGLIPAHAGDSQALIQLKQCYCDTKRCLFCRIGYEFLKGSNKETPLRAET